MKEQSLGREGGKNTGNVAHSDLLLSYSHTIVYVIRLLDLSEVKRCSILMKAIAV